MIYQSKSFRESDTAHSTVSIWHIQGRKLIRGEKGDKDANPAVCTHVHCTNNNKDTQLSVAEQQCFLSVACYLCNKHLHMKNNLQSVFILRTVSC